MQHAEISHRLDSSNPRDEVNLADDGALCLDALVTVPLEHLPARVSHDRLCDLL